MLYFTVNVSNKLIVTLISIHSLPAQAASLPRSQSAPTQASKAYKSAAPSGGNRGGSGVAGSCPGDIQGSVTSLTRETRGSVTSLTREIRGSVGSLTRMDEELNNWSSDDYDEIDPTTRQRTDYEYNAEFQVWAPGYRLTFRLFLSEHRATRSLHLSRSLAIQRAPCQLTPISSRSSWNVLRHVFFSLPAFFYRFLAPSKLLYGWVCLSAVVDIYEWIVLFMCYVTLF